MTSLPIPMAGGFTSRGLPVAAGRRALMFFDLDTLAPAGSISGTIGVHDVAVDPKSAHGFSSSNPVVMFDTKTLATLTIIKENSPTHFQVEQTVKTMPGAKTCTLDRKANQIFLITAEYGATATAPAGQAAGGQGGGRRGGRASMVPGSFTILEVGK